MRLATLIRQASWRAKLFAVIAVVGLLDWFNVSNPCEWPLLRCPDYPFRHHPQVTPGLYPPLIFDEGCTLPNDRVDDPIGWECRPNTWSFGGPPGPYCEARCNVSVFSWAYTAGYWWLISSAGGLLLSLLSRRRVHPQRSPTGRG